MKVLLYLFLYLMIPNSAFALPASFVCRPISWYSGFYEIYSIREIVNEAGDVLFEGKAFRQTTSGHSISIGKPRPIETVELKVHYLEQSIVITGLQNPMAGLVSLNLPFNWDGKAIGFKNKLFLNDRGGYGVCYSGSEIMPKHCEGVPTPCIIEHEKL